MRRNEDGLRFRRRKYPKIQEIFSKICFSDEIVSVTPSALGQHKYTRVMTIKKDQNDPLNAIHSPFNTS